MTLDEAKELLREIFGESPPSEVTIKMTRHGSFELTAKRETVTPAKKGFGTGMAR